MRVWFSQAGLSKPAEEHGWVFVETLDALAGVRAVSGATTWDTTSERVPGTWLRLAEEWSPVILEVAGRDAHADAAAAMSPCSARWSGFVVVPVTTSRRLRNCGVRSRNP